MTQRCGYKSAAPPAGFVQFIAHFSQAFVLIDSLPHMTCAFVVSVRRSVRSFCALTCQVHLCVCFFVVVFFPLSPVAPLSDNNRGCLFKKNGYEKDF